MLVHGPQFAAPFAISARIQTNILGLQQQFLGWGTGSSQTCARDSCLTSQGQLEYGEHSGIQQEIREFFLSDAVSRQPAVHPQWNSVTGSTTNLADVHGVAVSRHANGAVTLWVDGVQ
eukprot:gene17770-biopygen21891